MFSYHSFVRKTIRYKLSFAFLARSYGTDKPSNNITYSRYNNEITSRYTTGSKDKRVDTKITLSLNLEVFLRPTSPQKVKTSLM